MTMIEPDILDADDTMSLLEQEAARKRQEKRDRVDEETRLCEGCDNIQREVKLVGSKYLCKMCRTPEDDWRKDR